MKHEHLTTVFGVLILAALATVMVVWYITPSVVAPTK